jgi:signal transduction histidine kinase
VCVCVCVQSCARASRAAQSRVAANAFHNARFSSSLITPLARMSVPSLSRYSLARLSSSAAAAQLASAALSASALPPAVCHARGARLSLALRELSARGGAAWPSVSGESEALLGALARGALAPAAASALSALQLALLQLGALAGAVRVEQVDVAAVARGAAADVSELCVDKLGVAPRVDVFAGDAPLPAVLGARAYLAYALRELLKNAAAATVERFGALRVDDDAPPLTLHASAAGGRVRVALADAGGGLPGEQAAVRRDEFPWFATTSVPAASPTYTYSRDFVAPFRGAGTGLARAALVARWHGGGLALLSQPGHGVIAALELEVSGKGAAAARAR